MGVLGRLLHLGKHIQFATYSQRMCPTTAVEVTGLSFSPNHRLLPHRLLPQLQLYMFVQTQQAARKPTLAGI